MNVVATDAAVIGRSTGKCYVGAEVILPCGALLAFMAGNTRFDGDAVAHVEVCDVASDGQDLAGGFVTEDVVIFNYAGTDCASFPEV
jgi:hypothetical protein